MTDQSKVEHSVPRFRQAGPPCPKCAMPSRYAHSLLDVKRDRSVLIYRCAGCAEEIWTD